MGFGTSIGAGALRPLAAKFPVATGGSWVLEGNMRQVAGHLFTQGLWAFELVSVLILVAMVGAIVVAKHRGGSRRA